MEILYIVVSALCSNISGYLKEIINFLLLYVSIIFVKAVLTCDFSGLTLRSDKGFTWQAPAGNWPSPHQTWCTAGVAITDGGCRQGLRMCWLVNMFVFLALLSSFPGLFNWQSSSGTSAKTSLWGRREEPWRQFYPLWLSTHSFSTPSPSLEPNP